LENIRDWCISRQLWWGHRIPVWYCECGETIVAREEPKTCPKCGSSHLEQDPDVLDTWFSSGLWPFSTMGWPEDTALLKQFYPTSVLVTGRDIIFFWVARMIFMGLEFMKEEPFKDVLIHGLVLDKFGKKMSKSRPETIVDPQDIIDQFGADTLRFTLATGTALGQDQRFQMEKVEGIRNFANKIWNAARFVLMNLEDYEGDGTLEEGEWNLPDRWILSRLQRVTESVAEQLERYDIGGAANVLYDFIWSEYCDWYIELAKPRLKAGGPERRTAQNVLATVLRQTMELLHPYMPFITEEIWQALPHTGSSIMVTNWPKPEKRLLDEEAERSMEMIMEIVRAIRNIRAEAGVEPSKRVEAIFAADTARAEVIRRNENALMSLAGLGKMEVAEAGATPPAKAMSAVAGGVQIFLPLAGLVDLELELQRIKKELAAAEDEIKRLEGKLSNAEFVGKAPAAVVDKEKAKLTTAIEKAEKLKSRLVELG
jgi:valyl-tRNA synthetase